MSDPENVFTARVNTELVDNGEGMAKLRRDLKNAAKDAHGLNHELGGMEHESTWRRIREHLGESNKQFGEMAEHVKGVHEHLSELLPALGALGAVGSVAGLFETVEKTAESYGELAHTAESLGMQAGQLQIWNTVAKLTDTNAEAMEKSLARLNRTLGEVTHGGAKDAAALFRQLHLDPRQFHDAADALPALADAFAHTNGKNAVAMRARMAQALFGRGGVEMIPLLNQGGDKLREQMKEGNALTFDFSGYGEGLEHYNEAMKKLGISVHSFTDELGAKLAPALQPIVDDMQEWVTANRDWLTSAITDDVRQLSDWIKGTDWHHVGEEIDNWTKSARGFVGEIGGATTAIEILAGVMAVRTVFSIATEIRDMIGIGREVTGLALTITRELVPAWRSVGEAATAASAAEHAAAAGSVAGAAPGAGGGGLAFPIMSLAQNLYNLWQEANKGVPISRDSLRADPSLAKQLTPEQIAKLPEHGGWRTGELWGTPGGETHSLAGDNLTAAWHAMAGGDRAPAIAAAAAGADRASTMPPTTAPAPAPMGPHRVELSGQANVTVYLPNAPPGATAAATGTGVLAKPTVQLGQAWYDHYQKP